MLKVYILVIKSHCNSKTSIIITEAVDSQGK
jgi:hypothetical protein